MITDYRSTWEEGKDYSDLLEAINEIDPDKKVKVDDFRLRCPAVAYTPHGTTSRARVPRS
ncbi:hypothetical protein [Muribaculum gordoncarteri]|uniref:hypothetical protein n=1 Tax=Muribaculum gordoncarteri TaxID=2530390 RepID=UPI003F66D7D3